MAVSLDHVLRHVTTSAALAPTSNSVVTSRSCHCTTAIADVPKAAAATGLARGSQGSGRGGAAAATVAAAAAAAAASAPSPLSSHLAHGQGARRYLSLAVMSRRGGLASSPAAGRMFPARPGFSKARGTGGRLTVRAAAFQQTAGGHSQICKGLSIGTLPTSARGLEDLVRAADVNAVICLEASDMFRSGAWMELKSQADKLDVPCVLLPMAEFDTDDQAAMLPQAVAAVRLLMERGHNVYVCCSSGDSRAALVAIGHLTFALGERYDGAVKMLQQHRPSAKPLRLPWEKARDCLAEGSMERVQALTHEEFKRRLLAHEEGTHTQDFQVALGRVAHEKFLAKLQADLSLMQELSKAASREAQRSGEEVKQRLQAELEAAERRAEAAEVAATSANDRISFFFRQVSSLKKKEEASRILAKEAERKSVTLARELQIAIDQNRAMREELKIQEEKARKEAAEQAARVAAAAAAGGGGRSTSADLAQLRELEALLADTTEKLKSADEKNHFLMRQLQQSRESEQKSRAVARASDARYAKILKQVEELGRREAAARAAATSAAEKYKKMNEGLLDLGFASEGMSAIGEVRVRLADLSQQVAELRERESLALAATAEAMEKLADVTEKLEMAEEREREAGIGERRANERAEELERRLDRLVEELAEAKAAAASAEAAVGVMAVEVEQLKQREAAADEAIKRYETLNEQVAGLTARDEQYRDEIAAATERISALSELISSLGRREAEMQDALETANEQIELLSGRVAELKEREEEARAAAASAAGQVGVLKEEMEELYDREAAAYREAAATKARLSEVEENERAAQEAARQANERVQELFAKVTEMEQRELDATAKAEEAYERLAEMTRMMELAQQEKHRQQQQQLRQQLPPGEGDDDGSGTPWSDVVVFEENFERELMPVSRQAPPSPPTVSRASTTNGAPLMVPPVIPSSAAQRAEQLGILPSQATEDERENVKVAAQGAAAAAVVGKGTAAEVTTAGSAELAEKRKALGATLDECVGLFVSQVGALKEREHASREALAAAHRRIEALSAQVAMLAKREEAANSLAEDFASQVTALVTRIADLNEQLEEAEKREADLAEALTNATTMGSQNGKALTTSAVISANGQLLTKVEPKVLVAELESARQKADALAAEVEEARKMAEDISENIFNARKRSLQEQQQREELVAEVVALKEAMVAMRERDESISSWKQQLVEQADYLESLMGEGDVGPNTRELLQTAVRDIQA